MPQFEIGPSTSGTQATRSNVSRSVLDLVKKSVANPSSRFRGIQSETNPDSDSDSSTNENENNDSVGNSDDDSYFSELDIIGNEDTDEQSAVQAQQAVWVLERVFESQDEFKEYLKNEKIWSKIDEKTTNDGVKYIFRCNQVKKRGPKCPSGKYTLHGGTPGDDRVFLFQNNLDHDHTVNAKNVFPLSEETKRTIIELFHNRCKPKGILYKLLLNENTRYVTINQIKNFLAEYKEKHYGNTNITLNQLTAFAAEHLAVPDEIDKAFVVKFERSDDH